MTQSNWDSAQVKVLRSRLQEAESILYDLDGLIPLYRRYVNGESIDPRDFPETIRKLASRVLVYRAKYELGFTVKEAVGG